jgi:hypothetical protein
VHNLRAHVFTHLHAAGGLRDVHLLYRHQAAQFWVKPMCMTTPYGPQAAALANRAHLLQKSTNLCWGCRKLPGLATTSGLVLGNPQPVAWSRRRFWGCVRATPAATGVNPQQPGPGHCNQVPYVSDEGVHMSLEQQQLCVCCGAAK